jgi:hypothetical protein
MRFPALILVPILALGLTVARAASLPDTGQNLCDSGSNVLVACSNTNTGNAATYPRQDGRFGRDAKATAGTLTKIGGGAAGFDYSKIAFNGSDLGAGVGLALGNFLNVNDWACTRDNITGLTWEVKSNIVSDLDMQLKDYTYTWYNSNSSTNGGAAGTASNPSDVPITCYGNGTCDTEKYVADLNTWGLCGHSDWRMPTIRELRTLVHHGAQNPSIDPTYFPNTVAGAYWSGSPLATDPFKAWYVDFSDGHTESAYKFDSIYVLLVRGAQF